MSFDRVRGGHVDDCGYVSVLEDRSKPDGNVIRLAVARLRGSSPPPRPDPVIDLASGPGTSALKSIDWFIDDARFIWEEPDLILLDQRGIRHSEPRLEWPEYRRQNAELREARSGYGRRTPTVGGTRYWRASAPCPNRAST